MMEPIFKGFDPKYGLLLLRGEGSKLVAFWKDERHIGFVSPYYLQEALGRLPEDGEAITYFGMPLRVVGYDRLHGNFIVEQVEP